MARFWLISIGAGVISALLYLSVVLGVPSAMLLAYLAQLPLFAVALGMGGIASLTATGSAALVVASLGGVLAGGLFLVVTGLPVLVIGGKALLGRQDAEGKTEWYPLGLLVGWLVGIGAGVFTLVGIGLALGTEGMEISVRSFLGEALSTLLAGMEEAERTRLLDTIAPWFPAALVMSWLFMVAINAALAQGVLARFGRNLRPSPELADIELPSFLTVALGAAGLAAALGPDGLGFLGRNLFLILLVPFFFVGLGVVHSVARKFSSRKPFILVAAYAAMFVLGWPVVLVAGLGLFDQWLGLRRRLSAAADPAE
jgi:hypothetical protein